MGKRTRMAMAVALAGAMAVAPTVGATAATKKVRAKGEKWRPVHTYIGRGGPTT